MLYTGLRFYSMDQDDDPMSSGILPSFLPSNRDNPTFSRQDQDDQE